MRRLLKVFTLCVLTAGFCKICAGDQSFEEAPPSPTSIAKSDSATFAPAAPAPAAPAPAVSAKDETAPVVKKNQQYRDFIDDFS